jgi:hypothetical protein
VSGSGSIGADHAPRRSPRASGTQQRRSKRARSARAETIVTSRA